MKIPFLLLLLSLPFAAAAQKLHNGRTTSYYTYIFPLTNEEAIQAIKKHNYEFDELGAAIDSFPTDSTQPDLAPGNYVLIFIYGRNLIYQAVVVSDFQVKLMENEAELALGVYDSLGRMIPNAKVHVKNKEIPYDPVKQLYRLPKSNRQGLLVAEVDGKIAIYGLGRDRNNGWFVRAIKNIWHGPPLRWVGWPFRNMLGLIDLLIYPEFRKYHRENAGYIAFNKPKYLSGDTMQLKAFLLKNQKRPLKKDLVLKIQKTQYPQTTLITDTISPTTDGAFLYEFVVNDTLQMNSNYMAVFEKKNGKIVKTADFYLEDYQLDKTSYNLRSQKSEYKAEPITLYASGQDANGFPVLDGRLNITVKVDAVLDFYPQQLFIPDTLWRSSIPLEPLGETKIIIPDSVIPNAKLKLKVNVLFNNSNNETHDTALWVTIDNAERHLELAINDSLFSAKLFVNGESVPASAMLRTYGPESTFRNLYPVKELYPRKIQLPFNSVPNPLVSRYIIESGNLRDSIESPKSPLQLTAFRTVDSVFITFKSRGYFPVHYTIYMNKKPVQSGTAKELTYWNQDKSDESYSIICNYLAGGKAYEETRNAILYDKNLNIQLQQPTEVYPGQKTDIKIKVTDIEGEPVKNVNLTASAINSEFDNAKIPAPPYLGRINRSYPFYNSYNMFIRNTRNHSEKVPEDWLHRAGTDSIPFFKLLFPDSSLVKHYEAVPTDSNAQLAPFVVSGGFILKPYLIYIDNKLVYYAYVDAEQPYSFVVPEGFHRIRIRTRKAIYTIDSVLAKKGQKLDIVLNLDIPVNEFVKVNKSKAKLSKGEKRLLNWSLFIYKASWAYSYIYQDTHIQKLDGGFYRPDITAGPFTNGKDLTMVGGDVIEETFEFESGYNYEIGRGKVKMKEEKLYNWRSVRLYKDFGAVGFGDWALTMDDLPKVNKSTTSDFQTHLPFATKPGKGTFTFITDSVIQKFLVIHWQDTAVRWIIPGKKATLYNITPGFYSFYFISKNGYYLKIDSLNISENGVFYYKFPLLWSGRHRDIALRNFINALPAAADSALRKYIDSENSVLYKPINFFDGEFIYGYVLDSCTNRPLAGASVIVAPNREGGMSFNSTDSTGFFLIPELAPGPYRMIVARQIAGSYDPILNSYKMVVEHRWYSRLWDSILMEGQRHAYYILLGNGPATPDNVLSDTIYLPAIEPDFPDFNSFRGNGFIPNRSVNQAAAITGGVYNADGSIPNLKGARIDATKYYVDGMKVQGLLSVHYNKPLIGGIPAEYGDVAGGTFSLEDANAKSLRSNFSDYAYWQPNLITNDSGEASFTATFPDNVTQWQSYAIGMDGKRHSGIGYARTKAYKKVMAQLALPRFMIAHDTAYAIGKALNYTSQIYPVKTRLTINGRPISEKSAEVETAVIEDIPLVAAEEDSISVVYSLEMENGYQDGEKREIPVYPIGVQETVGSFHILAGDTAVSIAADPQKGPVTVHAQHNPIDFFLRELDESKRYPYDCNEQIASKLLAYLMENQIREALGERFRHEGETRSLIRKLQQSQKSDGTWGWWPDSRSNLWMTSYVMVALHKAGLAGYSVKEPLYDAVSYLRWHLDHLLPHDRLMVLNTLSEMGEETEYKKQLDKLKLDSLPLHDRLLAIKIRQQQGLSYDLNYLLSQKKETFTGGIYWGNEGYYFGGNSVELTLLAYRILQKDPQGTSYLSAIRRYLLNQRTNGRWHNTIEAAGILSTLLPEMLAQAGGQLKPVQLTVNGQAYNSFPLTLQLNSSQVQITKMGSGDVMLTAYQQYFNTSPKASDSSFAVTTSFEQQGQSVQQLEAGKPVTLTIEVNAKKAGEYMMLEIPIPAGCSYGNNSGNSNYYISHTEYRHNKTVIFCEDLPVGKYVFKVELEPRFKGNYTLNPTQAELMYFPVFSGRNGVGRVWVR